MPLVPFGDPGKTFFIERLLQIEATREVPTTLWLTASEWAAVVAELDAQFAGSVDNQSGALPPWYRHDWFTIGWYDRERGIPRLTVRNGRTDDEREINRKNGLEPHADTFKSIVERKRVQ